MSSAPDAVSQWRTLADKARAVAERMTDQAAKRAMLSIAQAYERLATRAKSRDDSAKST